MKVTAQSLADNLVKDVEEAKVKVLRSKKAVKYQSDVVEGIKFTVSVPDLGSLDIKVKKDDFSDIENSQYLKFTGVRAGFIGTGAGVYLWLLADDVEPAK